MEFLMIIGIIILSLWLLGQLGRWWLRRWVARNQQEFARRFGAMPNERQGGPRRTKTKKEGEVRVEQTVRMEKRVNERVGDYVEFEEVEITEEIIEE
jgi:hypothetical protein